MVDGCFKCFIFNYLSFLVRSYPSYQMHLEWFSGRPINQIITSIKTENQWFIMFGSLNSSMDVFKMKVVGEFGLKITAPPSPHFSTPTIHPLIGLRSVPASSQLNLVRLLLMVQSMCCATNRLGGATDRMGCTIGNQKYGLANDSVCCAT